MLKSRVIPCLDVNDGRVVKGVKFQNLRDAGCPVELSFHYEEQGADELVLLDVTATRQERIAMLETVDKVRKRLSIPLTVGGCLLYTSPSPRDKRQSRMPSSA